MFTHLVCVHALTARKNIFAMYLCVCVCGFYIYVNARKALERAHKISYLMVLDSFFEHLFIRASLNWIAYTAMPRHVQNVYADSLKSKMKYTTDMPSRGNETS